MIVFIYTVTMFGFAYIVGHSTISLPFRHVIGGVPVSLPAIDGNGNVIVAGDPGAPGALGPIGEAFCALIECPACLGFWLGMLSAISGLMPVLEGFGGWNWPIVLGCYTSGANFILARLTRLS